MNAGELARIAGERGSFRVVAVRTNGDVDLWGGTPKREKARTVTPDRVQPPTRNQAPPASAAEHRAKGHR